jgi:ABC-type transport system involved in cytochrome bd biosynthesis fused ATPase/permease subunit
MNFISIKTTVTIGFIISIALLIASFLLYLKYENENKHKHKHKHVIPYYEKTGFYIP